jgi:hypothetical protein
MGFGEGSLKVPWINNLNGGVQYGHRPVIQFIYVKNDINRK